MVRTATGWALLLWIAQAANVVFALSPQEAAQNLASESDPNGFVLMVVCISILFVFALSLIIATSLHLFKRKPTNR